ncbi:MAG: DMT family transporter [Solirubrobacteraceae bacterium]
MSLAGLASRPRAMAVLGALAIAFSAILVRLAEQPPSTSAFFRCLYALPILGLLAWRENRRLGPRPTRSRKLAWAAGLLFAADLIFWHHTIENVGAGLGTVLGNLQVAMVPFVAWFALGEHPTRRVLASLPLVLIGIVLISGVLEEGAYGSDPGLGVIFGALTGLSYAGFLLVLRAGGADLRRPAGPLYDATLVAAVAILAAGAVLGELRLEPSWPAHGWLVVLALTSQVLGWLLITSSLPRLPAALSSILLTIQPVGSVLLGIAIFSESPTALQVAGIITILSGLVAVSARRNAVTPLEP